MPGRLKQNTWNPRHIKTGHAEHSSCDQQHDLAVRKFERIVMGHCLFFVDLPKDRRPVVEHVLTPAQWTLIGEGQQATVLQLPAEPKTAAQSVAQQRAVYVG